MENASDALIIAGSVLLLIIALTVSISSFSNLKTQVDELVSTDEKLDYSTIDGEYLGYLKSKESTETRIVEVETIISAIRRIRGEGYTIYIEDNDIFNNSEISNYFEANGVVESDYRVNKGDLKAIKLSEAGSLHKCIEKSKTMENFYKILMQNNKKYKEYVGVYQNNTEVSSVNKTTYKIITFVSI